MKYKLIFSDIDGTLIDDNLKISPETAAAVQDYTRAGGQFVICTGRLADSAVPFVRELKTEKQRITAVGLQGSQAITVAGENIHRTVIDWETAYRVITLAEETDTYCHIYDFHSAFIKEYDPINLRYREFTGAPLVVVGKLSEYIKAHRFSPSKIMTVITPGTEAKYYELYKDVSGIKIIMSSHEYFEIISDQAGKGEALKKVAAYLGIDIADTIAIGDNMNDIEMIQAAGLGIAVRNGAPSTLSVAKYVTERDNNHAAVAEVIRKFGFLQH